MASPSRCPLSEVWGSRPLEGSNRRFYKTNGSVFDGTSTVLEVPGQGKRGLRKLLEIPKTTDEIARLFEADALADPAAAERRGDNTGLREALTIVYKTKDGTDESTLPLSAVTFLVRDEDEFYLKREGSQKAIGLSSVRLHAPDGTEGPPWTVTDFAGPTSLTRDDLLLLGKPLLVPPAPVANGVGASPHSPSFGGPVRSLPKPKVASPSPYLRNLTGLARAGALEEVSGRDAEIEKVRRVLVRGKKSNALLVGEPGVGKTAVVEGLAQRLVRGELDGLPPDTEIYSVDLSAMTAGTQWRGMFEERLQAIIKSPATPRSSCSSTRCTT